MKAPVRSAALSLRAMPPYPLSLSTLGGGHQPVVVHSRIVYVVELRHAKTLSHLPGFWHASRRIHLDLYDPLSNRRWRAPMCTSAHRRAQAFELVRVPLNCMGGAVHCMGGYSLHGRLFTKGADPSFQRPGAGIPPSWQKTTLVDHSSKPSST